MTKLTTENLPTKFKIMLSCSTLNPIEKLINNQEPGHLDRVHPFREELCDALNYHAEQVAVGFGKYLYETIHTEEEMRKLFNKYLKELKQKQG